MYDIPDCMSSCQ